MAALLWCVVSATAAAAREPRRGLPRLSTDLVWSVGETPLLAALSRPQKEQTPLDASLFAQELFAFAMKEALPDAEDEYLGTSRIPSRLSGNLPDRRNPFGEHCLHVANGLRLRLAESLGFPALGDGSSGVFSSDRDVPALLTAALALQGVWRGLRNEIADRREGVSLRPKISRRTLALNVTFRW
ncbi:MAG: hypothetical protein ACREQY_13685 [Candidatus Binatia bacterium]